MICCGEGMGTDVVSVGKEVLASSQLAGSGSRADLYLRDEVTKSQRD